MTTIPDAIVSQLAERYIDAILARTIGTPRRVLVGVTPHVHGHAELPDSWTEGLPDEPEATMDLSCARQVLDRVVNELPRRGMPVTEQVLPNHERPDSGLVIGWRFDQ